MTASSTQGRRVLSGDFARLYVADAVSTIGKGISALAIQLLLIDTMAANQSEIGLVRGAQWLPYLLFGLLGGVIAERFRRRPQLILSNLISAAAFGSIGVLALLERLTIPMLAGLVFIAGAVTCVSIAAAQSFVPRLVPGELLPDAFARQEQLRAVADSVAPLTAGALVRALSAPIAVLVDAACYLFAAVMTATIRTTEPARDRTVERHLMRELREGASWVYRHRMLRPYALTLHLWFVGYAVFTTVVVFYARRELGLDALMIGVVLAAVGVSSGISAGLAPRLARRFGIGRVIVSAAWATPVGALVVALAEPGAWAVPVLIVGHLIFGLNAPWSTLSMTYRTIVTPDRLRARMNATIRTVNWSGLAVASVAGGWLATSIGNRPTLLVSSVIMAASALLLGLSRFREARSEDGIALDV